MKKPQNSSNPDFRPTTGQIQQARLLESGYLHNMAYGGSRSAKTFGWCWIIANRAYAYKSRHLIMRRHFKDVRQSVGMETWPEMMEICWPGVEYEVNHTDWFITLEGTNDRTKKRHESVIWLGGLDEGKRTDKVLGREYSTIFVNETSEILNFRSITTIRTRLAERSGLKPRFLYDQNPPVKSHWTYKEFELGINPASRDEKVANHKKLYGSVQMNPDQNKQNIAEGYIETILAGLPERQKERFLRGEYQEDAENALWKIEDIDYYRVSELPDGVYLVRIVVAVDPAVTSKPTSDETGIVVAGKGSDGIYYILADLSALVHVTVWGKITVDAYRHYKADRVLGETNNGGDLVEVNIQNYDRNVSYGSVHASRGKAKRAEPVAALYPRGLVRHVGTFRYMEDEMTSHEGALENDSEPSPNRMDALVWAVTELAGIDPDSFTPGELTKSMGEKDMREYT